MCVCSWMCCCTKQQIQEESLNVYNDLEINERNDQIENVSLVDNEETVIDVQNFYSNNQNNFLNKYIAIADFEPGDFRDLEVKKNDIITIMEKVTSEEAWYIGTNETSNKTGLVPMTYLVPHKSLESEPWFFPKFSYYDAENSLLENDLESGTFLVRPSRVAEYTLAVRYETKYKEPTIKHHHIYKNEMGSYYFTEGLYFESLQVLVKALLLDRNNDFNIMIKKPCPKMEPPIYELSGIFIKNYEIDKEEILTEKSPFSIGVFSNVYKGKWKNKLVAVRILKNDKYNDKILKKELDVMKNLKHKNIIAFYGICSITKPYYIIQEFMKNGDLLNYVRKYNLSNRKLYYISCQILEGMCFLESKSMIHRDLTARNILVGEKNIVKISDFGLSVFLKENAIYTTNSDYCMSIRHLAPESMDENQRIYTNKTDVWSFGVLLMEIYTRGESPYNEIEDQILSTQNTLYKMLCDGYRMPKPELMPEEIYKIIEKCWDFNPNKRPSFIKLLDDYLKYEKQWS